MSYRRGDVVTRDDRVFGVVWDVWPNVLRVMPVAHDPVPVHRGDVGVWGLCDLAELGSGPDAVVRAGMWVNVKCDGQRIVGRVSAELINDLHWAFERDYVARQWEAGPRLAVHLWGLRTSRGRQIKAVAGAA